MPLQNAEQQRDLQQNADCNLAGQKARVDAAIKAADEASIKALAAVCLTACNGADLPIATQQDKFSSLMILSNLCLVAASLFGRESLSGEPEVTC